jgi:Spy/CpxP family protein refolding chaperone
MSVATATGAGARRVTPRRLWPALLAVSVALNLCFVAGAVWSRVNAPATAPSASDRFHRLGAKLDLTDEQRGAFQAYVAATMERTARQRREIDPLLDAAWAEVAKPQPDNSALIQRFDDVAARWRGFQHDAVNSTLALLAKLTPDQRAKFVADELERRATVRHRRLEEAR